MCCGHVGLNLKLKPGFVKPPPVKRDVGDMRVPLSIVAASVLLQLTIAARYTFPIGFSSTDAATLEKKAAFSLFLLAEAISFMCSASCLFCIWGSKSGADTNKSAVLFRRSIPLLSVALLGTLVVFVTGVSLVSPVSFRTVLGVMGGFFLVVFRLSSSKFLPIPLPS